MPENKKVPDRDTLSVKDESYIFAVPPWFAVFLIKTAPFAGYHHIPGNWRMPSRCRILGCKPLTAPSAVHLMTCFPPDSQRRRLSVGASSPLSPLQRFDFIFCFSHATTYFLSLSTPDLWENFMAASIFSHKYSENPLISCTFPEGNYLYSTANPFIIRFRYTLFF